MFVSCRFEGAVAPPVWAPRAGKKYELLLLGLLLPDFARPSLQKTARQVSTEPAAREAHEPEILMSVASIEAAIHSSSGTIEVVMQAARPMAAAPR